MMNPKTDPNDMNASSAACRVDSTKKKTRSRFVWGCLLVVSLILVMLCIPIYFMLRGESYWAWRADRVTVLLHEVIEPLEKKYEFQNDIGSFHNWTVSFRLEVKNPDQLTEIVKEVYTLKQNSPGLSREVFDVEFVSSDPQNPVRFRVVMPGENGYEGRRTASVYSSEPQTEAKENDGAAE